MKRLAVSHIIIVVLLLFSSLSPLRSQSVGLVLSGGGAKGLSHIGVIRALEENGIPIDYISGTSIGSIVGGLYAIGLSPDDMIAVFKSDEFKEWYKGRVEREFDSYLYAGYPTSSMVNIDFQLKSRKQTVGENGRRRTKHEFKVALPTSLVSPYPMDMAFVQLFANASAAADYDFDRLMIPFFCVSADILRKKPFISDKGDLGSAIRASMTFPAYFKPILIDSTLLFDGGLYNNFPWEIMEKKYSPDIIIGAKCVKGEPMSADQEDVYRQVELIMSLDTDYQIPEEKGLVISGKYDYSLLEFDKVDELVQKGYDNAMARIEEIKAMISRRKTMAEVQDCRIAFRKRCSNIRIGDVQIQGNLNDAQKRFIRRTFLNRGDTLSVNEAKRRYFRVLSSNTVRTFYPTLKMREDSLFTLNLQATAGNTLKLGIGGNISSSSLMQGSLNLTHTHFSKHPWKSSVSVDIGQFFTGAGLYFKQDIGIKPLFQYEIMFNAHMFDYFGSSQNILFANSLARNIQESEVYATVNVGTPISYRHGLFLEFGVTGGHNHYRYYPVEGYSKYDKPHRTYLSYLTTRLKMAQSTLDYNMFPTNGRKLYLEARYILGNEYHQDGTTIQNNRMVVDPWKNVFVARFNFEDYYKISDWFSLGYSIDLAASTDLKMHDYTSTMVTLPAFQPTFHSRTLMLEFYRAPIFVGATLTPVFKITETLYFHLTGGYFQPYKMLQREAEGMYGYSQIFPRGGVLGNVAFVWQSPVGPISLSCAYYEKGERTKWYPSLNIGFLIFREHGLRN